MPNYFDDPNQSATPSPNPTPPASTTPPPTPPVSAPTPAAAPAAPEQPLVYSATNPTPLQDSKPSKKKWFFIGGAIVLVIALLVGGYFGLKNWADNAAIDYARAVDSHLDRIFEKTSRTERLKIMDEPRASLQPVFLGTVVSATYKNADETLDPLYNETIDAAKIGTQAARDANESLTNFLNAVRDALLAGKPQNYTDKSGDANQIATSIESSFKIADKLDAAADTLEQATTLKDMPSYQKAIDTTHKWAETRREIAVYSAKWVEDVVNWAGAGLEEVNKNLQTFSSENTVPDFDTASYQAKMNELTAAYTSISNQSIGIFNDLVDEKLASGVDDKTQALLDKANAKVVDLDKKLKEFLPAEELKNN